MTPVQRRRLDMLASFLEENSSKFSDKWDMTMWTHTCGTPACAAGWATTIPEFRESGLFLTRSHVAFREFPDDVPFLSGHALAHFFGTTKPFFESSYYCDSCEAASCLFVDAGRRRCPSSPVLPQDVAGLIRDMLSPWEE